jgi:hypothetical protein
MVKKYRLGLGTQKLRPGRPRSPRCGADTGLPEDRPYRGRRDRDAEAGQLPDDPPIPPRLVLFRDPQHQGLDVSAGRRSPIGFDLAAQRRRRMSRRQRRIVPGVTISSSRSCRALGIRPSRNAISARSAQDVFGRARAPRWRCMTASWCRNSRISAFLHAVSRRDRRVAASRWAVRRKTKRRHTRPDHRRSAVGNTMG